MPTKSCDHVHACTCTSKESSARQRCCNNLELASATGICKSPFGTKLYRRNKKASGFELDVETVLERPLLQLSFASQSTGRLYTQGHSLVANSAPGKGLPAPNLLQSSGVLNLCHEHLRKNNLKGAACIQPSQHASTWNIACSSTRPLCLLQFLCAVPKLTSVLVTSRQTAAVKGATVYSC